MICLQLSTVNFANSYAIKCLKSKRRNKKIEILKIQFVGNYNYHKIFYKQYLVSNFMMM